MDEYRVLAEKAIAGKKESMPTHNGSVAQYQKRYEVFMNVIKEADVILKDLGNSYIKNHQCTLEQIETMRNINKELVQSFISHFNSNR